MDKLLKDIREIEFERIDYFKESEEYFVYEGGKIPILISAPHGARHLRDGKWKEEDEYTAAIAIKLAELTDAHVIYVKNRTTEDSNHDEVTEYKSAVKKIAEDNGIKFLIDIHGADKDKTFNICVGTIDDDKGKCSCPTYKDIVENSLKDFQESPIFNRPKFKASNAGTVTYFAKNILNIEAAQFELNGNYRIVERKPNSSKALKGDDPNFKAEKNNILELISVLVGMITNIRKKIESQG